MGTVRRGLWKLVFFHVTAVGRKRAIDTELIHQVPGLPALACELFEAGIIDVSYIENIPFDLNRAGEPSVLEECV